MIKKTGLFLALFTILLGGLLADWRAEIYPYFGQSPDFRGALNYLQNHFESFDEIDKAIASGLAAFASSRLNDKPHEYRWIGEYFETYFGDGTGFYFLGESVNNAILEYIKKWLDRYPLVTKIGIIKEALSSASTAPAQLIIGLEVRNNTHYKLSDERTVLKGGMFIKGFNTLSISAEKCFEDTGVHLFYLDLKAGDFVVRKEVKVDIKLESRRREKQPEIQAQNREYTLSMFIGDRLIASSRKSSPKPIPSNIAPPPGKGRYSPFGPIEPTEKPDPFSSSGSILDAVAVIYNLIKEATKKKVETPIPPIEPQQDVTFVFFRFRPEREREEVKASLSLQKRNVEFLVFRS